MRRPLLIVLHVRLMGAHLIVCGSVTCQRGQHDTMIERAERSHAERSKERGTRVLRHSLRSSILKAEQNYGFGSQRGRCGLTDS